MLRHNLYTIFENHFKELEKYKNLDEKDLIIICKYNNLDIEND